MNAPWRVYRGSESRLTWWGSDAEFGAYVEDAGRKAIRALVLGEGSCEVQS
ncbi:hypothetical protein [Pseudomarimonas arenosa]|uniref:Uncharacterized protein n=1 Tax=Pseudomarimonas arenosa TaxID=2774145 RepID=A0AAW3ZP79_9GAMM|nr:hypothetical protein [Pseudomarimonas arenosa]MBD8526432.1 hypothetical protein [Pseudomarimonas arenosa]